MRRVSLTLALVGAFLAGGLLMNGMLTRADDKTEPKVKGTLYQNWKKLGLTDDQTQKIYKIQARVLRLERWAVFQVLQRCLHLS